MKRKDLISAAAAAFIAVAAGVVWFAPWAGQAAPDVTMRTLDGERVALSAFEGEPVLIQFWATTCVTCVAEMPHLKALHAKLADKGFTLLAVAMEYDPPKQVARMVEEKALPYEIALDTDGSVARAFGDVRLTPTSVLIDPRGRIVWQRMGELDFDALAREIRGLMSPAGTG